jgi:hypothetical protein
LADHSVSGQGGDHTPLSIVKNRPGKHRWTTDIVEQLLTELVRILPDSGGTAALLNCQ